jgi:putative ABC transport system permease protein
VLPVRWIHDLAFRLRALFTPGSVERDMDDEMAFHLDMEAEKYIRQGMSETEARARALRSFGSVARQKEYAREAWGVTVVRDLIADGRHAWRQMRRNPGFAAATLLTLALSIGANTAIFSIADRTLLQRPSVRDPSSLAAVYTTCRRGFTKCSSSYPDFIDYRERTRSFADMAGYSSVPLNVGDAETARLVTGQLVSGNYFSLLGARAHLGRLIQPDEDRRDGATPVVVVSHGFWAGAMGADSTAVGSMLRVNGAAFTVVGVAERSFHGLELGQQPDLWLPMFAGPALGESAGAVSRSTVFDERGNRWIGTLVGRLRPNTTLAAARAEMDALAAQLGEEFPEERAAVDGVRGITVDAAAKYILPVRNADELRQFVLLLFGVVALTLALAAANVANLLLARASARAREIGVRLALGARRGRLVRQLLTESAVLAIAGGAAGLVVARIMLDLFEAFELPGGVVIGALGAGINTPVLAFALVLSLVTALLFGLAPALRATGHDLVSAIKGESSERGGADHGRVRKWLVTVQVALCLILLVGSGLFVRTLRNSLESDLGFEPRQALAARFNLGFLQYGPERTTAFVDDLLQRVRAVPGVRSASVATLVPFQGGGFRGTMAEIGGYVPAPDEEIRFDYVAVTAEYITALGMRLVEGRAINASDIEGGRPVAVINRVAADRYWPNRSAVGGLMTMSQQELEIVGVVDDPKWQQVGEPATPYVFLSMAQFPALAAGGFLTLTVRTDGDAAALIPVVRERFRGIGSGLPLTFLRTMDDLVGDALMPQRMGTTVLTLFGALALVLAAVGIYGIVGYAVARRSREIGIRIAVGAGRVRIMADVLREMALPVFVGLAAGGVASLALGRTVQAFLFQMSAADPLTFLAIGMLLLLVATLAALIPARRAAALDPVKVLSSE